MKELSLSEIRIIELEILKHFKEFCEKNDIKYYLSNGTLLGAVKYKGFIPWDDDIDVFVPRKDYDRLIETFQDSLRFRLFSVERNGKYCFPFAKLCDMTTVKVEEDIDNGVALGLDIDIFPLDAWDVDVAFAKKELKRIQRANFGLNMAKLDRVKSKTKVKRLAKAVLIWVCKRIGAKSFIKRTIRVANRRQEKEPTYLGCKVWPIYGEREIVCASVFAEGVELEFEGEKFVVPIGYDEYLRSLYGDYEQDPPLEKQRTHHRFKAFAKD